MKTEKKEMQISMYVYEYITVLSFVLPLHLQSSQKQANVLCYFRATNLMALFISGIKKKKCAKNI